MKTSIIFTGLNSKKPKETTILEFSSWKGRPQKPQRVIDYTTRLGGSELIISNTKNESAPTTVNAIMVGTAATVKTAIAELETNIKVLLDNIGTRFTWTDENGITIQRCYIMNLGYNIVATSGVANAIANITMTIMVDTADK